jgi:DNA-binding NarL/FixJ family response regulator
VREERRCLVVDDHAVVRLGVRELLEDSYEVDEAEDGEDALHMLTAVGDFDVAVVDTSLPSGGQRSLAGTAIIRALLKARPGLGIVAHGERAERHIAAEAMSAGARAFVAKSSPARELTRAVEAAVEAETFIDPAAMPGGRSRVAPTLTKRQRQILQLFANGNSTNQSAKSLGLSAETVRTHTKALLARLDARDRAHAVAIALRNSLIE